MAGSRLELDGRLDVFVRSMLEYCSQAWCPWTIGDKETLEKVQCRAVRMLTTLPHDMSYEDKLKLLGPTTLIKQRQQGDMIQMFRSLAANDPSSNLRVRFKGLV